MTNMQCKAAEEETDPDVLSLPDIADVCVSMDLWTPGDLSPVAQQRLKRAVVSCIDQIGETANRLEVEDIVARAADAAPITGTIQYKYILIH